MSAIEKVNLKEILPNSGPSVDEVKKYLEKYTDENIVIKCGGSDYHNSEDQNDPHPGDVGPPLDSVHELDKAVCRAN